MEILYFLIPISMVLVGLGIWAFFWAVKSGQFDDLEGPAYRILMDDEPKKKPVVDQEQRASELDEKSSATKN